MVHESIHERNAEDKGKDEPRDEVDGGDGCYQKETTIIKIVTYRNCS